MIGHPSETQLLRFLDGTAADGRRQRLANHLADCQRCRDLVQAHRRVRLALTMTEPTPPPPMVFDRVLATRASGEGVILPVEVEPGQRREWRLPFSMLRVAGGVLAGALVLAVGLVLREVVPPLPVAALSEQTGKAFERLIEQLGDPSPREPMFKRPDAPPAVIHPERMREFTALYEARHYRGSELIAVDSSTRFSARRIGNTWAIGWYERNLLLVTRADGGKRHMMYLTQETTLLDAETLMPRSSQAVGRYEREFGSSSQFRNYRWLGDSALLQIRFSSREGGTLTPRSSVDTTVRQKSGQLHAPDYGGLGSVRSAFMQLVDLDRWWAGGFSSYQPVYNRPSTIAAEQMVSSRILGSRTLDLPIGRTATWEMEDWQEDWGVYPDRKYYRKSDGLLAAHLIDRPYEPDAYTELRLLSVTYP
jgi:hypothetical protein